MSIITKILELFGRESEEVRLSKKDTVEQVVVPEDASMKAAKYGGRQTEKLDPVDIPTREE